MWQLSCKVRSQFQGWCEDGVWGCLISPPQFLYVSAFCWHFMYFFGISVLHSVHFVRYTITLKTVVPHKIFLTSKTD